MNLKIAKDNEITFPKSDSQLVESYDVFVTETSERGDNVKRLLVNIPHDVHFDPVFKEKIFKFSFLNKYKLPPSVVFNEDCRVSVLVNDKEISSDKFTYSTRSRLVRISASLKLKTFDVIKVRYYSNDITYTHTTQNDCKYTVTPILKNAKGGIGHHSLLR